jgi:hypothetical protein
MSVPYPESFVVLSDGNNYGAAFLLNDCHTIKQTQPIAHCTTSSSVTSLVTFPDVDLYTDGILGAHGGSGLSAIGGTIRLGEYIPDVNGIVQDVRHALKSNLWAVKNYYRNGTQQSSCYRWPAVTCDGYFDDGNVDQYGGLNPQVRMTEK